jgi:TetR/AcrR family transcriptional repressor of nem operon
MAKGEITKDFIIQKAAPVFNMKGMEATAMSDIMEVTKLSKGSLYVYFKNKEELIAEVFSYNVQTLRDKIASKINHYNSAKERLFAYIDVLTDMSNPPVIGGCPLMNFGIEADDTNPATAKKITSEIKNAHRLISEIILKGIEAGEFKHEWNYQEFSKMAFAMIEGGVMISRITNDDSSAKVVAKALKQMIREKMV